MKLWWLTILGLNLALGACKPAEQPKRNLTSDPLGRVAHACFRDVEVVAFERSGNCLAAVKEKFARMEDPPCEQAPDRDCEFEEDLVDNARQGILRAIGRSLWNHGKPSDDTLKAAGLRLDEDILFAYHDPEPLEKMFNFCLAQEKKQLSRVNQSWLAEPVLMPAHEVSHIVLREGQLCIREGYEERESI